MDVPEWLLGMTRNHVGFPRVGSNPAVHDFIIYSLFSYWSFYYYIIIINIHFSFRAELLI